MTLAAITQAAHELAEDRQKAPDDRMSRGEIWEAAERIIHEAEALAEKHEKIREHANAIVTQTERCLWVRPTGERCSVSSPAACTNCLAHHRAEAILALLPSEHTPKPPCAVKHGKFGSPEYGTWLHMRGRCNNPTDDSYAYYGGRGITVCAEWNESFEAFYRDMGDKPSPKHSLDRIDNELGYSKANCRWATRSEQNSNRRPATHCRNGHEYTPENTIVSYHGDGRRQRKCRECRNAQSRNRRLALAALPKPADEETKP